MNHTHTIFSNVSEYTFVLAQWKVIENWIPPKGKYDVAFV